MAEGDAWADRAEDFTEGEYIVFGNMDSREKFDESTPGKFALR